MIDDAIHIRNPNIKNTGKGKLTLCNLPIQHRTTIHIKEKWPNMASGCWTCLANAELVTEQSETKQ